LKEVGGGGGAGRVSALLTVLARGVHTCRENPGIFVIGNQGKQQNAFSGEKQLNPW